MTRRREFLQYAGLGMMTGGAARAARLSDTDRRKIVAEARFGRKKAASGKNGVVVCAHPLATHAGIEMLKSGGNACDAACTVAVTQTVVEPHMTTITGVFSMLYYDAKTGKTTYMNGGMNVPKAGLPGYSAADMKTGRGAGVPGWWGGFEAALAKHGTKPKSDVMATAIGYARDGFEVHPFLYGEMYDMLATIGRTPEGREIFMPHGTLLVPGQVLKQEKAARTLERLQAEGSDYFYRGDFAKKYSEVVKKHGGVITPEDFAAYKVRWDEPARSTYRGYDILASPPPDNGGTHIIEALNIIELMDLQKLGPPSESAETMHGMLLISNEVMSAGARQTDPNSHPVPLDLIVSKDYARTRWKLLKMSAPLATTPPAPPGSNHVTVVDASGNVATVLHSCMALPWSNGLFVEGVSICASGGHFLRVMPKPGDRASAYVGPNMLFKNGKPILASGSPSVSLIANILQNTVNLLDFGIPIEDSIHRPRFGAAYPNPAQNMIEADVDEKIQQQIIAKGGVALDPVSPWYYHCGSFEGIYIDPATGVRSACGDPRRAGQAEGY